MKRFVKFLSLAILTVIAVCCFAACGNPGGQEGKTGLLYKKFGSDDFYTVYGYVDENKGVTELDIGEAVPEDVVIGRIKKNAFNGNDTLLSVIVPSTVETIDEGAFAGMRKLSKISLPFIGTNATGDAYFGETATGEDKAVDEARTFGYIFGTESYNFGIAVTQNYSASGSNTYYLPLSLKEVTVAPSDDYYSLPMYAFSGNTRLTTVNLGENVSEIGEGAFKDCVMLETVTIPSSVTVIGDYAFSGCVGLKDKNGSKGFSFAEESTLMIIGEEAFKGVSLSNVALPETVEKIGTGAFRESKIASIVLPVSVTVIKGYAFYACQSLETVSANGVTEIGVYAFYACDSLNYFGKQESGTGIDLDGVTILSAMSFANIDKTVQVTGIGNFSETVINDAFYETEIAE